MKHRMKSQKVVETKLAVFLKVAYNGCECNALVYVFILTVAKQEVRKVVKRTSQHRKEVMTGWMGSTTQDKLHVGTFVTKV